ncbi:hypothetical protein [Crateriforma spongiae]|uniref:hypothetical protein n=1 Tax=Crateriforma spongiae TaxID=2724528 RepID=UPI0039AED5D9
MFRRTPLAIVASLLACFATLTPWGGTSVALGCPFCNAISQTLRQEMQAMDVVAIATVVDTETTRDSETGGVRMRIETILKGDQHAEVGDVITAIYFGEIQKSRRFLVQGAQPPDLQWSSLPVNERVEKYVIRVSELDAEDAASRLRFFIDYLQDEDSMLSRDAYDEFAITPYEAVREIKDDMDHAQLIQWIEDPELSADRKRLYLTMLGVCGSEDDLPMLERMLRSEQKSVRNGLDALIACYLTLAGEKGLPLINEKFLANRQCGYGDTYAAIMAIRFHGTEGDVIARSALIESLHLILQRPDLADLVIPDLARWEDWSQIDRMKQLFLEADEETSFVRVPVVNYLKACPKPEAREALDELSKVDPEAVRRANMFFSIPKPQPEDSSDQDSGSESENAEPAATSSWRFEQTDRPALQVQTAEAAAAPWANLCRIAGVMAVNLGSIVIGQYLLLTGGAR